MDVKATCILAVKSTKHGRASVVIPLSLSLSLSARKPPQSTFDRDNLDNFLPLTAIYSSLLARIHFDVPRHCY